MCDCADCKAGGPTYTEEFKQACLQRARERNKALAIMEIKSLEKRREALSSIRRESPEKAARIEEIIKAEWGKRK